MRNLKTKAGDRLFKNYRIRDYGDLLKHIPPLSSKQQIILSAYHDMLEENAYKNGMQDGKELIKMKFRELLNIEERTLGMKEIFNRQKGD